MTNLCAVDQVISPRLIPISDVVSYCAAVDSNRRAVGSVGKWRQRLAERAQFIAESLCLPLLGGPCVFDDGDDRIPILLSPTTCNQPRHQEL